MGNFRKVRGLLLHYFINHFNHWRILYGSVGKRNYQQSFISADCGVFVDSFDTEAKRKQKILTSNSGIQRVKNNRTKIKKTSF